MAGDTERGGLRRPPRPKISTSWIPSTDELTCSIEDLRGKHRAAHIDEGKILESSSHLLMVQEWPVHCPRLVEAVKLVGLYCVSRLQFRKMDNQLLTALVERWSPKTNSFHLPVGEMTITLQDVAMLLGLQIDGPAIIGPNVVGEGRRWLTWPDCCDELLGSHPDPDVEYHDPRNPRIRARFKMGQAQAKTCMPLRWLRWTFCEDSYLDFTEAEFRCAVRAYILFMIGSYLLPDTSGSEVHLRYLPMLEDLEQFSTYSIGSAVLCQLYRELTLGTKPHRVNIAGCIHLLQLWSWERLHVGRPTHAVPEFVNIDGLSVGYRWNHFGSRHQPTSTVTIYRDELEGLLDSQVIWEPYTLEVRAQVSEMCLRGAEIWLSTTPLICWTRVEWHIPERVQRQFGLVPSVNPEALDASFCRSDGRGKYDTNWMQFYDTYIGSWENRRLTIVRGTTLGPENQHRILRYLKWFRAWAKLYLLKPPKEAPTSYYQRAPLERHLRDYFLESESTLQPFFGHDLGVEDLSKLQPAMNHMEELIKKMHEQIHFSDERYIARMHTPYTFFNDSQPLQATNEAGTSSQPIPSQILLEDVLNWSSDSGFEEEPVRRRRRSTAEASTSVADVAEEPSMDIQHTAADDSTLCDDEDFQVPPNVQRLRKAPEKYTPGTNAIYRRRKK